MNDQGDITVIGNVGGIHLLEDIKVGVPCNEAVYIPAEKVIRSRDLQIALQRKLVRKASREAGSPMVVNKPSPLPPSTVFSGAGAKKSQTFTVVPSAQLEKSTALEEENRRLRIQLQETQKLLSGMQEAEVKKNLENENFQNQLDKITFALERIEKRPPSVVIAPSQEGYIPQPSSVKVDDTPAFIQNLDVRPDDISIELEAKKDSSGSVMSAAKKLKSLRKKETSE